MECKNHAGVEAIDRCTGCAEAFCSNCLVEIRGQKYCSECKQIAFAESQAKAGIGTIPNEDATRALQFAIIGIFCFGIILGPMAIMRAKKAKEAIAINPRLDGAGKATAATIIGIISIALWAIGIISRLLTL